MADKRIAQTQTPKEDLGRLIKEYNLWMNSMKDIRQEWERVISALDVQLGKNSPKYLLALAEQSRRPKFKDFCKKLDEYGESYRELVRLCRLTEKEADSSESWAWMIKDSIAPKDGKPGHPFYIPGKIKHFQEGPGVKQRSAPKRNRFMKM